MLLYRSTPFSSNSSGPKTLNASGIGPFASQVVEYWFRSMLRSEIQSGEVFLFARQIISSNTDFG